jgi:hypothetical protein
LIGTVYSGINNIFRIRGVDNLWYECRIKGKILKDEEESYNPLAPGHGGIRAVRLRPRADIISLTAKEQIRPVEPKEGSMASCGRQS